jgi:hypothetical protein
MTDQPNSCLQRLTDLVFVPQQLVFGEQALIACVNPRWPRSGL